MPTMSSTDGKPRKRSAAGERGAQALAKWRAERKAKGLPTGGIAAANNPLTAKGRDALIKAFDRLGGVDGLVKFAEKNPSAFYQMFFRAMPREREANALGSGITINVNQADDMRPVIDVTPTVKVNGRDSEGAL